MVVQSKNIFKYDKAYLRDLENFIQSNLNMKLPPCWRKLRVFVSEENSEVMTTYIFVNSENTSKSISFKIVLNSVLVDNNAMDIDVLNSLSKELNSRLKKIT